MTPFPLLLSTFQEFPVFFIFQELVWEGRRRGQSHRFQGARRKGEPWPTKGQLKLGACPLRQPTLRFWTGAVAVQLPQCLLWVAWFP